MKKLIIVLPIIIPVMIGIIAIYYIAFQYQAVSIDIELSQEKSSFLDERYNTFSIDSNSNEFRKFNFINNEDNNGKYVKLLPNLLNVDGSEIVNQVGKDYNSLFTLNKQTKEHYSLSNTKLFDYGQKTLPLYDYQVPEEKIDFASGTLEFHKQKTGIEIICNSDLSEKDSTFDKLYRLNNQYAYVTCANNVITLSPNEEYTISDFKDKFEYEGKTYDQLTYEQFMRVQNNERYLVTDNGDLYRYIFIESAVEIDAEEESEFEDYYVQTNYEIELTNLTLNKEIYHKKITGDLYTDDSIYYDYEDQIIAIYDLKDELNYYDIAEDKWQNQNDDLKSLVYAVLSESLPIDLEMKSEEDFDE